MSNMDCNRRQLVILSFIINLILIQAAYAGWDLAIKPRSVHVQVGASVNVLCSTNIPLQSCQFRLIKWGEANSTIMDLSKGTKSVGPNGYRYHGRGLDKGECGLTITQLEQFDPPLVVACRVRGSQGMGRWKYEHTVVRVSNTPPLTPFETVMTTIEAFPGDNVNICCKSQNNPLNRCTFYVPGEPAWTVTDDSENDEYSYRGHGLKNGDCGITLKNVTEKHNGWIWCRGGVATKQGTQVGYKKIKLVVLKPPPVPTLTVEAPRAYAVGTVLRASCTVHGSRPAAHIIWYFGTEAIRDDEVNDAPITSEWVMSYEERSITQNVSIRLGEDDDGKVLRCNVAHNALEYTLLEAKRTITFGTSSSNCKDDSVPTDVPLVTSGFEVGKTCLASIELIQIVKPSIVWRINREFVLEGEFDKTRRFEAALLNNTGNGNVWIANLYIHNVIVDDANTPYYLFTWNVMGGTIFRVLNCVTTEYKAPVISTRTGDPDCGMRRMNHIVDRISGGINAVPGQLPWHAGIYMQRGGAGNYSLQCGGTLISDNLVVSAAHCFYDTARERTYEASQFKVALGKVSRDWSDVTDEASVQRMDVREVLVPPRYTGRRGKYQYDVAVLRLAARAQTTDMVVAACVDWDGWGGALMPGREGVTGGWGSTESEAYSERLQLVDLPYVDEATCLAAIRDQQHREADSFYTSDKFCAGYRGQNISVCPGDSGGGLTFLNTTNNRYYLRGIISVSFDTLQREGHCAAQLYTGFTNMAEYMSWARSYLTS